MKIALSTDHAGFSQAQELMGYIQELGHEPVYFGPKSLQPSDDYPMLITPAAKAVAEGNCRYGIVLGGSGQGEAISANRIRGVRCAVYYGPAVPLSKVDTSGEASHDPYAIVRLSRDHNDANMLSLAARFVSLEEMKQVVKLWIGTGFSEEPRHARRIAQLDEEV